jgi:hypothetical protein
LDFSEIIDIAPFQGTTTYTSPVTYEITKTMVDPNDPSRRICDPNSVAKVVEGIPIAENIPGRNITSVSLRPAVPLPSQVCVRIGVTDRIRDLSGRAAEPQTFEFMTKILVSGEVELKEPFASSIMLDTAVSSGIWGGGKALPPRIGGTGELGEFDVAAGRYTGTGNHFVFNTDTQVIAAKYTPNPFGPDITVTGGVFEFSKFVLSSDSILEFEGSNGPDSCARRVSNQWPDHSEWARSCIFLCGYQSGRGTNIERARSPARWPWRRSWWSWWESTSEHRHRQQLCIEWQPGQ